jgi:hypothetical protein
MPPISKVVGAVMVWILAGAFSVWMSIDIAGEEWLLWLFIFWIIPVPVIIGWQLLVGLYNFLVKKLSRI